MRDENFSKDKKRIIRYCIGNAVICQVISLIILGPQIDFFIGITLGTLITIINFNILEKVIYVATTANKLWVVTPFQCLRYLLYGAAAYFCVGFSKYAAIAYAIGVLGLVFAMLINCRKGGSK